MSDLEIILRFKNILLSYISFNHIPDIIVVFRIINSSYYILNFDANFVYIFTNEETKYLGDISNEYYLTNLQKVTEFYTVNG